MNISEFAKKLFRENKKSVPPVVAMASIGRRGLLLPLAAASAVVATLSSTPAAALTPQTVRQDCISAKNFVVGDGSVETTNLGRFFTKLSENYSTTANIPATVRAGYVPAGEYDTASIVVQSGGVGWSLYGDGPPSQIKSVQFNLYSLWNQLRDLRLIGAGGGWNGVAPVGVYFGSSRAHVDNVQVYQRPVGFAQDAAQDGTALTSKNLMIGCLTYQCSLGVRAGVTGPLAAELHLIGCDITSTLSNLNPLTFTGSTHSNTTVDGLSVVGTSALSLWQTITGPGIPDNTFIEAIDLSGTSITISRAATATATGVSLTVTGPGVGIRHQSMGQLRTLGCHVFSSGLHGYEIIGHDGPGDALSFPNETFHTATLFSGAGDYGTTGTSPRQLEITNIQTHSGGARILVTVSPSTEDWVRGVTVDLETGFPAYDNTTFVVDVIAPDQLVLARAFDGVGPTTGTAFSKNWAIYAQNQGATPNIRETYFTGCYSTSTRLEGGFNWYFNGTRMWGGKWLNSYVGGLYEHRCLDSLYGGIGPSPPATNEERVRDQLWYGPGSIENVMEAGPFRWSSANGFNPVAGDLAVGMRMAYTASGLGTFNGPNSYNYVFVHNDVVRINSQNNSWVFAASTNEFGAGGRISPDDPPYTLRSFTADTHTNNVLDNLSISTSLLMVGQPVVGTGIPVETFILSITAIDVVTLTKNTTATAAGVSITAPPNGQNMVLRGGNPGVGGLTSGHVVTRAGTGNATAPGGENRVLGGTGFAANPGGAVTVSGGSSSNAVTCDAGPLNLFGGSVSATNGNGGTVVARGGIGAGTGKNGTYRFVGFRTQQQMLPTSFTTSTTATAAQLVNRIWKVNNGGGVGTALTLPAASDVDAEKPDLLTNDSFDLFVINNSAVAAEDVTMTTNTGWTLTANGSMVVQEGTSAHFIAQRTGAAAYNLYRVA